MTSDGVLDECTVIPVLEIPTSGDSKTDVKTIRALNPTQPTANLPGRSGRTWFLQPFGPGEFMTQYNSEWLQGTSLETCSQAFVLRIKTNILTLTTANYLYA